MKKPSTHKTTHINKTPIQNQKRTQKPLPSTQATKACTPTKEFPFEELPFLIEPNTEFLKNLETSFGFRKMRILQFFFNFSQRITFFKILKHIFKAFDTYKFSSFDEVAFFDPTSFQFDFQSDEDKTQIKAFYEDFVTLLVTLCLQVFDNGSVGSKAQLQLFLYNYNEFEINVLIVCNKGIEMQSNEEMKERLFELFKGKMESKEFWKEEFGSLRDFFQFVQLDGSSFHQIFEKESVLCVNNRLLYLSNEETVNVPCDSVIENRDDNFGGNNDLHDQDRNKCKSLKEGKEITPFFQFSESESDSESKKSFVDDDKENKNCNFDEVFLTKKEKSMIEDEEEDDFDLTDEGFNEHFQIFVNVNSNLLGNYFLF